MVELTAVEVKVPVNIELENVCEPMDPVVGPVPALPLRIVVPPQLLKVPGSAADEFSRQAVRVLDEPPWFDPLIVALNGAEPVNPLTAQ